jgi:hypothetical protein
MDVVADAVEAAVGRVDGDTPEGVSFGEELLEGRPHLAIKAGAVAGLPSAIGGDAGADQIEAFVVGRDDELGVTQVHTAFAEGDVVHPGLAAGGDHEADGARAFGGGFAFAEAAVKEVLEADEVREALVGGLVPDLLRGDDLSLLRGGGQGGEEQKGERGEEEAGGHGAGDYAVIGGMLLLHFRLHDLHDFRRELLHALLGDLGDVSSHGGLFGDVELSGWGFHHGSDFESFFLAEVFAVSLDEAGLELFPAHLGHDGGHDFLHRAVELVLLLLRQRLDLILADTETGFESGGEGFREHFLRFHDGEELFDGGGVRGRELGEAAGEGRNEEGEDEELFHEGYGYAMSRWFLASVNA